MTNKLYFSIFIDCEATQPSVAAPDLGKRSSLGFAEVLEQYGLRGTFHVLPTDAEAHPTLYRELVSRGHEIGLHIHPAADGYEEFLGIYGPEDQSKIVSSAADRFSQALGFRPDNICIGYMSLNDFTYGVLYDLGFRHGTNSIPTRTLATCASVHAGAPLDVHYAHRYNRILIGDLDFVEIPLTIDPDSRVWGGQHPQDLRVELVDAKNHWYTINKTIKRQISQSVPVKFVRGITHNTFDYSNPNDFRRQTLESIIRSTFEIAEQNKLACTGATGADIAKVYRKMVSLGSNKTSLTLDRCGWKTFIPKTH